MLGTDTFITIKRAVLRSALLGQEKKSDNAWHTSVYI